MHLAEHRKETSDKRHSVGLVDLLSRIVQHGFVQHNLEDLFGLFSGGTTSFDPLVFLSILLLLIRNTDHLNIVRRDGRHVPPLTCTGESEPDANGTYFLVFIGFCNNYNVTIASGLAGASAVTLRRFTATHLQT